MEDDTCSEPHPDDCECFECYVNDDPDSAVIGMDPAPLVGCLIVIVFVIAFIVGAAWWLNR